MSNDHQLTQHFNTRRTDVSNVLNSSLQSIIRQRISWDQDGWDILQEGRISLLWHRGHPKRREKTRSAWASDDWGIFLANLYASPLEDPSPTATPTRITQVICTDLAEFRQQL